MWVSTLDWVRVLLGSGVQSQHLERLHPRVAVKRLVSALDGPTLASFLFGTGNYLESFFFFATGLDPPGVDIGTH